MGQFCTLVERLNIRGSLAYIMSLSFKGNYSMGLRRMKAEKGKRAMPAIGWEDIYYRLLYRAVGRAASGQG
jgi:hypothetical protein